MRGLFLPVAVLLFLFVPGVAQATTRTASPSGSGSTCSVGTPCSLSTAITNTAAGDTVQARGGTYGARYTITNDGTSIAPIVIENYPGETPIIDGTGVTVTPSTSALVELFQVNYLTFRGFQVRDSVGRGINLYESNHSTLDNVEVTTSDYQPILVAGDSNTVKNSTVHDAALHFVNGVGTWPSCLGTWETGNGTESTNTLIDNNTVYNCWGEGIGPYHSTGTTITDNTVHDTWSVNIYLNVAPGATVERNFLYSTGSTYNRNSRPADGIIWASENGTDAAPSDTLIANNVILNTGYGIWYWHSFQTYDTMRVIHNVVKGATLTSFRTDDVPSGTQPTGNVLRNNIFYDGANAVACVLNDTAGWTATNNDFPSGTVDCGTGNTDNPSLVNATVGGGLAGFQLGAGSAVQNDGITTEVTDDAFGNTRDANPDPGIHELSSFMNDTFTGTAVVLTSHTSDSGHAWVAVTGQAGSTWMSSSGGIRETSSTQSGRYYANVTPPDADYKVEGTLMSQSGLSGGDVAATGVGCRMVTSADTGYFGRYNYGSTRWEIVEENSGTATITAGTSYTMPASTNVPIELSCVGTSITLKRTDTGATVATLTDSTITAAGKPGVRLLNNPQSATDGIHLDDFIATDL